MERFTSPSRDPPTRLPSPVLLMSQGPSVTGGVQGVWCAWCLFPVRERTAYREAVGLDDATWLRGRGWALSVALQLIPYYAETAPHFAKVGRQVLAAVVDDARL